MKGRRLLQLPHALSPSCVIVVAMLACSDGPRPDERQRETVHPQIITSELPPKIQPAPEPLPERPPQQQRREPPPPGLTQPMRQDPPREFYDFPAGYDDAYDEDDSQRANDALNLIMGAANNPFGVHDRADERDNPPNQPPEREVRGWRETGPSVKPRPSARITCEPGLVLRGTASENGVAVARLPAGATLRVIDRSAAADWILVDAGDDRRGWVPSSATTSTVCPKR